MILNIDHFQKDRAEVFLNSLDEEFEQIDFDWQSLKESGRIMDAVKLTNRNKTLIITLFFLNTYSDADLIAKANSITDTTRWGCNGSIMYMAESDDPDKVSDVVSTFAGRE